MKTFVTLVALLLVDLVPLQNFVNGQEEPPKLHILPEHEKMFEECLSDLGLTAEDLFKDDNYSKKPCFSACFMEKIGVVNDDGTYDIEKILTLLKTKHKELDAEIAAEREEAHKTCVAEANAAETSEKCERAGIFIKCIDKPKEK